MYKVGTVYEADTNEGIVRLEITRVTKGGIDFVKDYENGARGVGQMRNDTFDTWLWRNEAVVISG